MKNRITYNDIMSYNPCYDPREIGMSEDYNESIPNFIKEYKSKVKEMSDIIWLLCRTDYISEKNLRLFAVWCARGALKLIDNPDQRSINACDVAFRYAHGEASVEELKAAHSAAVNAVCAVAYFSVNSAVNSAVNLAVYSAVSSAAHSAHSAANPAVYSAVNAVYAANSATNNTKNIINAQLAKLERIINS